MGDKPHINLLRYRIVPGLAAYDRLELHVFARAYRDSWIALHAEVPTGRHWFERLGIAIDFSGHEQSPRRLRAAS